MSRGRGGRQSERWRTGELGVFLPLRDCPTGGTDKLAGGRVGLRVPFLSPWGMRLGGRPGLRLLGIRVGDALGARWDIDIAGREPLLRQCRDHDDPGGEQNDATRPQRHIGSVALAHNAREAAAQSVPRCSPSPAGLSASPVRRLGDTRCIARRLRDTRLPRSTNGEGRLGGSPG
jgi:hypothetical protein